MTSYDIHRQRQRAVRSQYIAYTPCLAAGLYSYICRRLLQLGLQYFPLARKIPTSADGTGRLRRHGCGHCTLVNILQRCSINVGFDRRRSPRRCTGHRTRAALILDAGPRMTAASSRLHTATLAVTPAPVATIAQRKIADKVARASELRPQFLDSRNPCQIP